MREFEQRRSQIKNSEGIQNAFCKLSCFRILSHNSKLKIYKIFIRPLVTYGCEAWVVGKKDEEDLKRFDKKILGRIFGPVVQQDGIWRIHVNLELDILINNENILNFSN